jgi:hypothetical protein
MQGAAFDLYNYSVMFIGVTSQSVRLFEICQTTCEGMGGAREQTTLDP